VLTPKGAQRFRPAGFKPTRGFSETQLEGSGRRPGLPDCVCKQLKDGGSLVKAVNPNVMPRVMIGPAPLELAECRVCALARFRHQEASGSLAQRLSAAAPLTCLVIFCIAFSPTGCRLNTLVTSIVRVSGYLIAMGLRIKRASRRGPEPVRHEPEAGHHTGTRMEWPGATGRRAGRRFCLGRHNLSQPTITGTR
jgi:hypothetical protein